MDIKIVICFIIICLIPPVSAVENYFVKSMSNTTESGDIAEKAQQENSETTKPLNVAPTDLVLFMIASYITIAGIIMSGALIAYSAAEVLR